jgi:MFS family permease
MLYLHALSQYEIGCFVGAVTTAFIGERLGRRKSILWGVIIMIAGALLQATAYGVPHLIVGRVVSGVGMVRECSEMPSNFKL